MTKLSIVTINLNNADGLERTIQSVINQTFKDFEYLIIDGGSIDGSIDVVRQFEDKIDYWISEKDSGIYNAMNKGIIRARGEYLLFLNSGDYLFSDSIIQEVNLSEQKADIVYGNQFRFGGKKTTINRFPDKLTFYWLSREFIGHNSTFIKRTLFETVGLYNEENKIVSDWEFFLLSICKYNVGNKYIDLTISAMEDGGISNNKSSAGFVVEERKRTLSKHFPLFETDYQVLDNYYNSNMKKIKRTIKRIIRLLSYNE